jgi:catechol 2,3-dioxygenase-like lactoylglutathione lyase family enzyme
VAQPRMRVVSAVLGGPDPRALAAFYARMLGWTVAVDEPARPGLPAEDGWVMLRPASGGTGLAALSFQYEPDYTPPVWPSRAGAQAMMIHLDIEVDDLDAAVAWALRAGATVAEFQPQDGVRVLLDPAGHPFCLFPGGG